MNVIRGSLPLLMVPLLGLLVGTVIGVVVFIALGASDLPLWGRVLIAVLTAPAIPGLAMLLLWTLVAAGSVSRIDRPEWMSREAEAWEQHGSEFRALAASRLVRVIVMAQSIDAPEWS